MTTNLTTEIQIDNSSLTGSVTGSSAGSAPAGSTIEQAEHAGQPAPEDLINNGTKVTRTKSAALPGDTTKSTSVPSQAVRRSRTVSSSSHSLEEKPAGELAEELSEGEDLGLLRRTRQKVVNAFK